MSTYVSASHALTHASLIERSRALNSPKKSPYNSLTRFTRIVIVYVTTPLYVLRIISLFSP